MNPSIMRLVPRDRDDAAYASDPPATLPEHRLTAHVRRAIVEARGWLQAEQLPDGCWQSQRQGDINSTSEYILLLAYLGEADSPRAQAASRWLKRQQLSSGGWAPYPSGPLEISTSVKGYLALKLTGHEPHTEYMQRAREAILASGGADGVDALTRFYLALLGQISYDQCPVVPSELCRTQPQRPDALIVAALAVIGEGRPVQPIDARRGIRELFLTRPAEWSLSIFPNDIDQSRRWSWSMCLRAVRRRLKLCERRRMTPLRRSVEKAERWILDHINGGEDRCAGASGLVWSIVACKCLGYAEDSPILRACRQHLDALVVEDGDVARLQLGKSPARDTAITLRALLAAGIPQEDESLASASEWLLAKPIDKLNVEDTATITLALWRQSSAAVEDDWLPTGLQLLAEEVDPPCESRERPAQCDRTSTIAKAERRLLATQRRDGGWGTLDRSTPDITGRVLEALGALGRRAGDAAVDRAIGYLRQTQEADGSWCGRTGVSFICGTWQALTGLAAVGMPADEPLIAAGANWLLAHQQACGGWGETPASFESPRLRGQGPVTASQSAWALLGLMAAGLEQHPAVMRGVRFLVSEQSDDGTWHEPEFTAVDFPQGGYLCCDLDRNCFPLLAMSRWMFATRNSVNANRSLSAAACL